MPYKTDGVYGVYAVTNTVTGDQYVGCSTDVYGRLRSHKSMLRSRRHGNKRMQASFDAYGEAAFSFALLEKRQDINDGEQEWIEKLRPVFNVQIPLHLLTIAGREATPLPVTASESRIDIAKCSLIVATISAQQATFEGAAAGLSMLIDTIDDLHIESTDLRAARASILRALELIGAEVERWREVQAQIAS